MPGRAGEQGDKLLGGGVLCKSKARWLFLNQLWIRASARCVHVLGAVLHLCSLFLPPWVSDRGLGGVYLCALYYPFQIT